MCLFQVPNKNKKNKFLNIPHIYFEALWRNERNEGYRRFSILVHVDAGAFGSTDARIGNSKF